MTNFDYQNPVKILFGEGKIEKLSAEVPKNSRILLTYGGGSIKRNGVYQKVTSSLNDYTYYEFSGIEPNPRYETLLKAIQMVKELNIDFILAVGGGSVIDGTKFICAASLFSGDPWTILTKNIQVEKAISFGTVLTIPATGSEMNSGAVISRESTKEKFAFGSPVLFPKFSILDPTTIYSLPLKQISNGIVDAYIHVMEQYLTYPSDSPIQDRFAEGILQTLIEIGPRILENPKDYSTCSNFMWSCTMALNGSIATGVPTDWATHMIGHELTALFGLDHGVTLAIVYPALLKEMKEDKLEKLLQYGERVWNIKGGETDECIEKIISRTESFFRSLNIKTRLSEYGITKAQILPIVERFQNRGWKLGERRNITFNRIEAILNRAI